MSRSDRWNLNKSAYIPLDKMQNVMKQIICCTERKNKIERAYYSTHKKKLGLVEKQKVN